jgi:hypothetical protein
MHAKFVGALLLLASCAVGNGIDGLATYGELSSASGQTPSSTDESSSSSSSDDGDSSGDDSSGAAPPDDGASSESTTGDVGTTTTDATAEGSEGTKPDAVCEIGQDDDACGICVKTSCCAEIDACASDAACTCIAVCVATSGNSDQAAAAIECAGQNNCNVDLDPVLAILQALSDCEVAACSDPCIPP